MMTCHGGIDARYHVASYTSDIVKLGQNDIDDPSVTEPCSIIISHCLIAILCPGENVSVDQKALKSVGSLIPVLKFVEALLRSSHTTYKSFTHTMCFLMDTSQNAREAFLSVRSSIAVMVACLRSSDLQLRIHALGGIMRLQYDVAFKGKVNWDPQAIMQNYTRNGRNTPDSVTDAMMDYGITRTEIILAMTCVREYQDAMMAFAHNQDFYALGLTLFDLIKRTEFSIADGYYVDEKGKPVPTGFAFERWSDALPLCAKAVREKGGPQKYDVANVIELKYFILRSKYEEARNLAKEGLKNNPTVSFYYYVLSLATTSEEDSLRWAKKGLMGKGLTMTPYVRFGLLFRAIMNAGLLGIEYLSKAEQGVKQYEEAYIFLRVALNDAAIFVAEAPPDNRNMPGAISWCILLMLTLRGPEISPDLCEVQVRFFVF